MRVKLILLWLLKFGVGLKKMKSRFGTVPSPGEFPFAVCVDGPDRCSGTLVTPGKFITAGQCFYSHAGKMKLEEQIVIMGVVDISNKNDPLYQERKIEKFKLHENYSRKPDLSYYNDIAAGYVDEPFYMSKTVQIAKFVSYDPEKFKSAWYEIIEKNEKCLAMGWGRTYQSPTDKTLVRSNELKYLWLTLWDDQECTDDLKKPGQIDMCKKGEVNAHAVNPNDCLISGDLGGTLVCGEFAYGSARGRLEDYGDTININYFVLFYPYIKYFDMDASTQIVSNTYTIISLIILQYF